MPARARGGPTPGQWLLRRVGVTLFLLLILVFWGIGLNFSFAYGLYNRAQTEQVIFNYLWELPALGIPLAVVVPLLLLRPVAKDYDAMLRGEALSDPAAAGRRLMAYPRRVVWYFTPASIGAYLLGNVLMFYTVRYPVDEFLKGVPLGLPLGLLFSLSSYLALVHLLEPVRRAFLERYGHAAAPPPSTSVYRKVVITSVTIVALSLGLLWLIAFAQGQILLEDQLHARMQEGAMPQAVDAAQRWGQPDAAEALAASALGPHGYAFLVEPGGAVVGGHPRGAASLHAEGFDPSNAALLLRDPSGRFTERVDTVRLVAFQQVPGSDLRVVLVTYRDDFAAPLLDMTWAMLGATALGLAIAIALTLAGARAMTRPMHALDAAMRRVREGGAGAAAGEEGRVPVLTDDEVGALAASYESMMARLRRQTQELQDHVERLKEMDAMKTQFINIASHELRTPMTPIRTELHLMERGKRGPLTPEQEHGLRMVTRNVQRLNRLILDLLEVSRMQAGQLKLVLRPVDLTDLLGTAVHTMRGEAQLKGVALEMVSPPPPGLHVLADEDRVTQVLINLLENAIQFTPAGGRVEVGCEALGREVRVAIRDNGVGIEPRLIPRLFQPFSQAEPGVPRTEGGTGLGLFISRGIIESHGGTMGCTSQGHGRGATFHFTLPVATGLEDGTPAPLDPLGHRSPTAPPQASGEPAPEPRSVL